MVHQIQISVMVCRYYKLLIPSFQHVARMHQGARTQGIKYILKLIIIFWEMTPCGSYKNRRFGGSYRLHLQGARVRAGYRAKL
jgi:hypothetical protein